MHKFGHYLAGLECTATHATVPCSCVAGAAGAAAAEWLPLLLLAPLLLAPLLLADAPLSLLLLVSKSACCCSYRAMRSWLTCSSGSQVSG